MTAFLEKYRGHLTAFLFIIYGVGVFGLSSNDYRSTFLDLVPLNLCLTFAMLLLYTPFSTRIFVWLLFGFLIGFGIEVAGVETGVIFGEYSYSSVLGPKLADTPLLIGVNWVLLSYCAAVFTQKLIKNRWMRMLFAALILVALDILIEPVAIHFNFWQWKENEIPVQNYIAWGLTALVIQAVYVDYVKSSQNKIATSLLLLQFAFFGVLRFII